MAASYIHTIHALSLHLRLSCIDALTFSAYQNKPRTPATPATPATTKTTVTTSRRPSASSYNPPTGTTRRPPPTMSSTTIASLKRIDRETLFALLKQTPALPVGAGAASTAVANPPTNAATDAEADASAAQSSWSASPVAIIDVRDSDYIGGHIRGCTNIPTQALDWKLPELVRTLRDKRTVVFHCALSQQRGPSAALRYLRERGRLLGEEEPADGEGQEVCVLEGGFVRWQEK